jgi:hypothetical protein
MRRPMIRSPQILLTGGWQSPDRGRCRERDPCLGDELPRRRTISEAAGTAAGSGNGPYQRKAHFLLKWAVSNAPMRMDNCPAPPAGARSSRPPSSRRAAPRRSRRIRSVCSSTPSTGHRSPSDMKNIACTFAPSLALIDISVISWYCA